MCYGHVNADNSETAVVFGIFGIRPPRLIRQNLQVMCLHGIPTSNVLSLSLSLSLALALSLSLSLSPPPHLRLCDGGTCRLIPQSKSELKRHLFQQNPSTQIVRGPVAASYVLPALFCALTILRSRSSAAARPGPISKLVCLVGFQPGVAADGKLHPSKPALKRTMLSPSTWRARPGKQRDQATSSVAP